jgi:chemotaxis protein histidine kinase CheA
MSDEADVARAASRVLELRARFGASLRERLDRLEALVWAAQRGSAEGALAEALVAAHRLAGTAGTYGHAEVGEAAAVLERALGRIAEGSSDPTPWDEAAAALARARAATLPGALG